MLHFTDIRTGKGGVNEKIRVLQKTTDFVIWNIILYSRCLPYFNGCVDFFFGSFFRLQFSDGVTLRRDLFIKVFWLSAVTHWFVVLTNHNKQLISRNRLRDCTILYKKCHKPLSYCCCCFLTHLHQQMGVCNPFRSFSCKKFLTATVPSRQRRPPPV